MVYNMNYDTFWTHLYPLVRTKYIKIRLIIYRSLMIGSHEVLGSYFNMDLNDYHH